MGIYLFLNVIRSSCSLMWLLPIDQWVWREMENGRHTLWLKTVEPKIDAWNTWTSPRKSCNSFAPLIFCHFTTSSKALQKWTHKRSEFTCYQSGVALAITVTTRMGIPRNLHFATVSGRGPHPTYQCWSRLICLSATLAHQFRPCWLSGPASPSMPERKESLIKQGRYSVYCLIGHEI